MNWKLRFFKIGLRSSSDSFDDLPGGGHILCFTRFSIGISIKSITGWRIFRTKSLILRMLRPIQDRCDRVRLYQNIRRGKLICRQYFRQHPEKKQIVIDCGLKLGFGFDPNNPTVVWIRPNQIEHIKSIIKSEEKLLEKTLIKGQEIVRKKFKSVSEITGKELCVLHHTYGIDPFTVEDIMGESLSGHVHDDYLIEYEKHRETGKRGTNPTPILIKESPEFIKVDTINGPTLRPHPHRLTYL